MESVLLYTNECSKHREYRQGESQKQTKFQLQFQKRNFIKTEHFLFQKNKAPSYGYLESIYIPFYGCVAPQSPVAGSTPNRQQFMDMLRDSSHNLHDLANKFMFEARYLQSQKILEDIQEKYMTKTAGNVDNITVYGGGSIQFKDDLYNELLEFANEVHCEVLWIPKEYAVDMNVKGMRVLNEKVLFKNK